MKYIPILYLFLFSTSCFAQSLDCSEFNEGNFIGTSPQLPGLEWKVTKKDSTQIEEIIKAPQEWIDNGLPMIPVHGKFQLIGECTYKFIYDATKMELDDYQIAINKNGGILVKVEKVEGDCFTYTSKSVVNGNEMVIEGTLCKQK